MIVIAIFLVYILASGPCSAQAVEVISADGVTSVSTRPRIGLVLSGGGARGIAHLGVIQVLEELRVPIDYIAGTSMGAIVGGLYASGKSTDDIYKILHEIDWSDVFNDKEQRRVLPFHRKDEDRGLQSENKIGFNNKQVTLPKGIILGQKLKIILKRLTADVRHVDDYDALGIPFRAVASDLETGQVVVLSSGDLGGSIVASMSIPGIIAPTLMNDMLLVDGGITNNLPVDVVREMGADIVIAVDISTPLAGKSELISVLAIADQLTNLLTQRSTQEQIKSLMPEDILIQPKLNGISSTSFDKVDEAIEAGRQAGNSLSAYLSHYQLGRDAYITYAANRIFSQSQQPIISFIEIENDSLLDNKIIESMIHLVIGEPLDLDQLERDIQSIHGMKLFESVSYRIIEDEQSAGIQIIANKNSWGPNYLQFGLNVQQDVGSSSEFNVTLSYLQTQLNPLGAEWRNSVQFGRQPLLSSRFYQPFDVAQRYYGEVSFKLSEQSYTQFEDDLRLGEYKIQDGHVQIGFGRYVANTSRFSLAYLRGVGQVDKTVGSPTVDVGSYDIGKLGVYYDYDSIDDITFPRQGSSASLGWEVSKTFLGSDQNYQRAFAQWLGAYSLLNNTLVVSAEVASVVEGNAPLVDAFNLGGFLNLSGYHVNQLAAGQHQALARAIFYRRIAQLGSTGLDMPVYLGLSAEAGNIWFAKDRVGFDSLKYSTSIFLGVDSFIGPVYLAYGRGEGNQNAVYLFVGQLFRSILRN